MSTLFKFLTLLAATICSMFKVTACIFKHENGHTLTFTELPDPEWVAMTLSHQLPNGIRLYHTMNIRASRAFEYISAFRDGTMLLKTKEYTKQYNNVTTYIEFGTNEGNGDPRIDYNNIHAKWKTYGDAELKSMLAMTDHEKETFVGGADANKPDIRDCALRNLTDYRMTRLADLIPSKSLLALQNLDQSTWLSVALRQVLDSVEYPTKDISRILKSVMS